MESPITLDNLYLFAYTNLSHLRREDIRGIALSFTGFNCAVYRVGQPEPEDEPFTASTEYSLSSRATTRGAG